MYLKAVGYHILNHIIFLKLPSVNLKREVLKLELRETFEFVLVDGSMD